MGRGVTLYTFVLEANEDPSVASSWVYAGPCPPGLPEAPRSEGQGQGPKQCCPCGCAVMFPSLWATTWTRWPMLHSGKESTPSGWEARRAVLNLAATSRISLMHEVRHLPALFPESCLKQQSKGRGELPMQTGHERPRDTVAAVKI